ncbi:MAG: hypothetical protein JKY98_03065 [Gammaproteobacteria bacterium]|nr:hypothetical protein [Gammaproteobacteria bacterium]
MIQTLKKLCIVASLLAASFAAQAQSEQATLVGSWTGSLMIGRDSYDMTINFTLKDGRYSASFISQQMGIYAMPADSVVLIKNRITIRLKSLAAEYTGRLRMDETGKVISLIDGEWFQEGEMVPVILRPAAE